MSLRADEGPARISGIAAGTTVRQQQAGAARGDRSIEDTPGLRSLRPGAIWAFLRKQPPSYWGVLTYLLFEYVRPQHLYEPLLGPPYTRIVVILTLGAFVMERRKIRFGTPEVLLAIFSLVVLASSIGAFYPSMSWEKLSVYFSWVIIYLIISNGVDTEERFFVFMLCFLLYSFKMSQFATRSWAQDGFVFRDWGAIGAPGFFRNSGEFGIQMCIFLPLMVAFIKAVGDHWSRWMRGVAWAVAGTAVTGIVASSSRGAVLGAAAVALWFLVKSRQKIRALVATVVLAGLVYAIIPAEQKARLQEMGSDPTSVSRTTYWKNGLEIMRDHPIVGIGYANWPEYHATYYGRRALPHNIFVEAGAELGYTGLAVFVALLVSTFMINRRTRQWAKRMPDGGRFAFFMAHGLDGAMVGFVGSGFFVTVLYYPFFWISLAMTVALNTAVKRAVPGELHLARRRRATEGNARQAVWGPSVSHSVAPLTLPPVEKVPSHKLP